MTKATETKVAAVATEIASESMKEKIAAIIAMAESTNNPHEADAFMNKAEKLLEKYQLSRWELGTKGDEMGKTSHWTTNKNPVTWKKYLINAVARYYGASALMEYGVDGSVSFSFVGRESSRQTAEIMYPFIMKQVKALGAELAVKEPAMNAKQHTRRIAHALSGRITKLIDEAAETKKGLAGERALTLTSEIDAYLESLGTTKTRGGKIGTTNSAKAAAEKVSLNKQANAANTAALAAA